MIVLLLPLVAAILIFVEPPPKYGARAAKAKEARTVPRMPRRSIKG